MTPARARAPGTRRQKLEAWLAECGLAARPRRVTAEADAQPPLARVRRALDGGGRLWRRFGRYLATRPDVLPAAECLAFDLIPDEAPAEPDVVATLESVLAARLDEVFAAFTPEPFESRLRFQAHRALLADGRRVVLRVAPPEARDESEQDLAALALLGPAFGRLPWAEILADFRATLGRDLRAEGVALATFARGLAGPDAFAVPAVEPTPSTASVLMVEDLGGRRLGESERGGEVARRLALAWLRQALTARGFPLEAQVEELPDGRLALTGGSFAQLPLSAQPNVWEYLRATAAHRPEAACEHLVRELRPTRRGATPAALELRLRQLVPFRDGCWSERGDGLAEHVVLHWRAVRECGYEPLPHLRDFFRGVFWVALRTHRLAPESDGLRQALESMQWLAGWSRLREWTDARRLGESLEGNLAGLIDLPRKVDRLLDLFDGEAPLRVRLSAPSAGRPAGRAPVLVVSLALALGTVALLVARLPALGFGARWIEAAGTAAFVVLGAWLLRAASRGV